jgi:hypothetical protein
VRKALLLLMAVFVLALVVGATLPTADAANCYYRCICSVPHKCCIVNGVEVCKKANPSPIQCPQDYPC